LETKAKDGEPLGTGDVQAPRSMHNAAVAKMLLKRFLFILTPIPLFVCPSKPLGTQSLAGVKAKYRNNLPFCQGEQPKRAIILKIYS